MSQAYQGSNPDGLADVPMKRKRGRPRKYPRLDNGEKAHVAKDQSSNHGVNGRVPPACEDVKGNQPRQVDSISDANDDMVGQEVSGVIEAGFDAGYLLSVRVGNSDTTLRGVVFKPGHFIPVSAENDVAPDMRMIRRNEIPLPAQTYSKVHGYNPRYTERQNFKSPRNGNNSFQVPGVAPESASLVALKGKQASLVVPRGNVVPLVLKPANGVALANQPSPVAIQGAHLPVSKSKQVGGAQSSDASTLNNQVPTIGNQAPTSLPQASNQVTPKDLRSENVPYIQPPPEVVPDLEVTSAILPGMPFENLSTEVSKKTQAPSESAKTEIESSGSAGKMSVKVSGHSQKDEFNDMDQPLLIEPLQAVQPNLQNQPGPSLKPIENNITGKMTELLQILQETAMENQQPAKACGLKLDEPRSPETNLGDKEIDQTKK
ncbi:hypothetical protein I3842_11G185800 [Carya illinoinensis]|uniref:AT hook motif-containing protein n=1 Tax=Carya illinoinensis TaxID=32201 RepID=A0A922DRU5_CARIL|nr:hypothetical protein I3842_11G185800 [Carya illinoinensis]KAG6689651.1 hypothetical protein I3842_11G185800 [Carya illinoinensis]